MLPRIIAAIALFGALASPCSLSFLKQTYHKDLRSDTPLFRFEKNGHAGFINVDGKVIIPPKFDIGWFAEEDFVEGLSPARLGENWGFIDTAGNWAIKPAFWRVNPFSEGLAAVTYPLKGYRFPAAYIDKTGKVVIDLPDGVTSAGPFSEGLSASVTSRSGGRRGYMDRSGAVAIPYQFAAAGPFREGLAAVVFDGHCYVEGRDGSPDYTSPSVPPATDCGGVPPEITEKCGEGFINKAGNVAFRFQSARDFTEGVAAVEQGGIWGFIDPVGRFRIQPRFESARSFHDGLAAAKLNGQWGYIDHAGTWRIPAQFAKADDFSDGIALTDTGYIDTAGRHVANANGGTPFVLGLAHVDLGGGEFGYINHGGKVVFRYRPAVVQPKMLPYSSQ